MAPIVVVRGEGVTAVDGDKSAMYVISRNALASYRTLDGSRRWTVPVAAGAQLLEVDDTRVVIGVDDPSSRARSIVLGLDAVTGAQVWQQTSYVPALSGCACADGVVVVERYPPDGDPEQERQRSTPDLAGIDVRTGAVRWSLVTPPESRRNFPLIQPDRVQIIVLDPDGSLLVHSAETGEVVQTVHLESPRPVAGLARNRNRLLTYESGLGSMVNGRVFDLATGRMLWGRTTAPSGESLWWCGRALCAQEQHGPIVVLDPDTGHEQWHLDGWKSLSGVGDQYLLATPSTPGGVNLVLDAASGRIVRRIDGWQPIGTRSGTRLLVSRDDGASSLVARLDVKTGGVTVLGRSAGRASPQACVFVSTWLACQTDQDRVSVWPVAAAWGDIIADPP
ncbi:PQQ-binding-like beta-propeller repeat protein [Dactylosporangium sp. NPDC000555]|uniref:outer membrane protein assembly factor BamB family protein n=1 Tax=Dactylosporangium sp. NPDC000555 TaxID=3154260 RepID=UPI00332F954D